MFRKSVFIMLFVCLLATISSAFTPSGNYPWDNMITWNKDNTDANWYEVANWDGTCPDGGPTLNNWVVIMPMVPGPQITGDANAAMLMFNGWDPTGYGPKDAVVTLEANAGNCNFGATIQINSWTDYDSYLGGSTLVSRAILNVYGGTITTPTHTNNQTNLCGIHIGGGASTYSNAYGILNIYGGEVNVPRLEIHFGYIHLYGGTLIVNSDVNFVINSLHPSKIDLSGGTFKMVGDHTADFNTYITNGQFVSDRGALGTLTYDGAWTTLTSTGNFLSRAWGPQPANNATQVHYVHSGLDPNITLTWNRGEPNVIQHKVYFGTSFADVNTATTLSAQFQGDVNDAANGDPCSWTISGYNFLVNTPYYWRVDENSVTSSNDDGTPKTFLITKGLVWTFTTHDGKAYKPKPVNGATALSEPLQLSWTAGDWAASTNGHKVYFTSAAGGGLLANPAFPRPTDSQYRGQQTGTTYSLANLAGAFTLAPGTTYYWCIDEVNGSTTWKGPLWSFTPATYINIDDFEDYNSTSDVNVNWKTGKTDGCPSYYLPPFGILSFGIDSSTGGKRSILNYNNKSPGDFSPFSEVNRPYIGGTAFTGSSVLSLQPAAIRVDYIGAATNSTTYNTGGPSDNQPDTIYVALEDTAGNIGVYYNTDPNAVKVTTWQQWYIALNDPNFSTVNEAAISNFYLGVGWRCGNNGAYGSDGNLMFDNIRLYAQTCNPNPPFDLTTDMDRNCYVDVCDLDVFADEWLWAAIPQHSITTYTAPHKAPVIWYKFNESSGLTAADSASGYTADVCQTGDVVWEPTGGRNGAGCLNFNTLTTQSTHVEVRDPNTAFAFMADANHHYNTGNGGSISFSVWTNGVNKDVTMTNNWCTVFSVFPVGWGSGNGIAWLSLPSRWDAPRIDFQQYPNGGTAAGAYGPVMMESYFGGKWNHWAAVKSEPNTLIVYCNGSEVVRATGADIEAAPFFTLPIQSFRLGLRGGSWANWGKWSGEMQDFKVYDYALDANEVAYEATDGTGVVKFVPLVSNANFKSSGDPNTEIVNFSDLSVMGSQWHQIKLWP